MKLQQRDINTIFIVMGYNCNMHCNYCCQHDCSEVNEKVSPKVISYIEQYFVDESVKYEIKFFGGEPLLYWSQIVEIVNHFSHMKNILFTMVTNGTLIDEKKVKFINDNNMYITVSWDGENTDKTRIYDVFKKNKNNLLQLNHLSVGYVLSSYSYPLDVFNEMTKLETEYFKLHRSYIHVAHTLIMDDESNHCANFTNIDVNKLRKQSEEICNIYYEHYQNRTLQQIMPISGFIEAVFTLISKIYDDYAIPFCSITQGCINMNMNGEIYSCQNYHVVVGDFDSKLEDMGEKIYEQAWTRKYADVCNKCSVQLACRNGCAMMSDKIREKYYCDCQRALYEPIIQLMYKMPPQLFTTLLERRKRFYEC